MESSSSFLLLFFSHWCVIFGIAFEVFTCRYDNGGISLICVVQSESSSSNKRSAYFRLRSCPSVPANAHAWHYCWCGSERCISLLAHHRSHHYSLLGSVEDNHLVEIYLPDKENCLLIRNAMFCSFLMY